MAKYQTLIYLIHQKGDGHNYEKFKKGLEFIGEMLVALLVLIIIISMIALPLVRLDHRGQIQRYNAFRDTLSSARISDFNKIEKASILTEIANWNMRIASAKYWRGTILRFYIPKEFTELEMIK